MTTTKIIKAEDSTPKFGDMYYYVHNQTDTILLLFVKDKDETCTVVNIGNNAYVVWETFDSCQIAHDNYMVKKTNEGNYRRFYGTVQLTAEI